MALVILLMSVLFVIFPTDHQERILRWCQDKIGEIACIFIVAFTAIIMKIICWLRLFLDLDLDLEREGSLGPQQLVIS